MPAKPGKVRQRTNFSNLIRYVPSGIYFARVRVAGKLIRQSLKTDVISVAKLRLGDLEKAERQGAEAGSRIGRGKFTFGDGLTVYRRRIEANPKLKTRSKDY